jgi:hypothetical protein
MKTPGFHGGYLASYYRAIAPDYAFRFKLLAGKSGELEIESPPAPYVPQNVSLGPIDRDTVRDIHLRRIPSVTISHVRVNELEGYMNPPSILVRLSAPAPAGGVRFTLASFDGTAMSDNDYEAFSTDISVPEGQSLLYVQPVGINYDPWKEADEVFGITARNLVGAWLPANGYVHIIDDDTLEAPEWVSGDFTPDQSADIIWRNPTSGRNLRWEGPYFSFSFALQSVAGTAWKIAGVGDFDNDLVSDLLWRNSVTGRNTIWLMGNAQFQREVATVGDTRWAVAGIGDFNGDERSDILWRHSQTGSNAIWKAGRSSVQQEVTAVTNPDWTVAGIGDFDGDDRDDIFWRNKRTGANVIWRSGSNTSQRPVTAVTNVAWAVAGVGDFDADGQSDIVWRDAKTGANVIWLSASSSKQRAVTKVTNLDWQVEAVADYNGDGFADLLWRNHRLGSNAVWLSANSRTQQAVSAVHPSWQVAP